MASSKRDLRRRIRAVKNIEKITQAMKMVAAAKLLKAQGRAVSARPFARELSDVLARLASRGEGQAAHPLLEQREIKTVAVVSVAADRGLCGSYNTNMIRKANDLMAEINARPEGEGKPEKVVLLPVGRRTRDFYRKRNHRILREYVGMGEEISFAQARGIARALADFFVKGEVDEVWVVYSEFINAMQQRPAAMKVLPVTPPEHTGTTAAGVPEHIYEPSAADVLSTLVPKYVEIQVYRALLEAKASEQGARMTAMGTATDNAKELGEQYTLAMNRVRQATITREIAELVGGAEALSK